MSQSESTSIDKLNQMLSDGSITEDDYHTLWSAMRGGDKPGAARLPVEAATSKKLAKSLDQGRIFGVCAGFASYFGVDPNVIRIFLLLTLPMLGAFTGLLYILAAILLPWDNPEQGKAFRSSGHVNAFTAVLIAVLFAIPVLFSILALPLLLNIYEDAKFTVWSSEFQGTVSGRAVDCLHTYRSYAIEKEALPFSLAIVAIVSILLRTIYANACNARFRTGFERVVLGGGILWLLFMVVGSMLPLFRIVYPSE
ncbi:MAG: hypothetical protein AMXMBFR84_28250 [Candidatus Hydrogenedentota bacterium]